MAAYQRACADGEAKTRRWRLMALGSCGDGKTSLISRLLGKGFTEEHIITNALETDCKVEITHFDDKWREFEDDHIELLDKGVTQSIEQSLQSGDSPTSSNSWSAYLKHFIELSGTLFSPKDNTEAKERLKAIYKAMNCTIQGDNPRDLAKFILSVWDLGGQAVYYVLHHIFLRWHCTYILVVNLSTPLQSPVPSHELPPHTRHTEMLYWESLEFWLNMIYSHMVKVNRGEQLPSVLVVGTHKDLLHENPQEQERLSQQYFKELQQLLLKRAHFQQVIGEFIAVDSKGGDPENYAKLKSKILDLVEENCAQSRSRPIRWLRLEKKLHELKNDESLSYLDQHLVSYERALNYGKQCHIQTDEDLRTFLEYHHLTADITYCGGEGLNNYIVPHPQWLVDVLRALITLDQFYPKTQRCEQEKDQLQKEGLLKTNGLLLSEVWKPYLAGDQTGSAKQYLLNLMVEFDLAVQYEENQYIIPCLLPVNPSHKELSRCQGLAQNLPALYYKFHSSADSYTEVSRGDESYDHFLPHGLFQKLISKCSKQGWAWTNDKYQDAIVFTIDDVLISLQARSTWIVLNVYSLSNGIVVPYYKYQSVIATQIQYLLNQYHPNMWYEVAVNPCIKAHKECLLGIGYSNFCESQGKLHGVSCPKHNYSLTTPQFHMWFTPSPCRALTPRDLKKVANELTAEWNQLNLATELDIPVSDFNAINADTPDIRMASFKLLMSWYDQQVYKVEAFTTLCIAMRKAGLGGFISKCLTMCPDERGSYDVVDLETPV